MRESVSIVNQQVPRVGTLLPGLLSVHLSRSPTCIFCSFLVLCSCSESTAPADTDNRAPPSRHSPETYIPGGDKYIFWPPSLSLKSVRPSLLVPLLGRSTLAYSHHFFKRRFICANHCVILLLPWIDFPPCPPLSHFLIRARASI